MKRIILALFVFLMFFSYCSSPPPVQKKPVITKEKPEKYRKTVDKLMDDVNRPKILVLSKDFNNMDEYTEIAINEINKQLGKLGFEYISHQAVLGFMQKINNIHQGQTYQDIASKLNSQYYITISLINTPKGKGVNNAYFSSVNITANGFHSETGLGVGTSNISSGLIGSMISQQEATIQAAKKSAQLVADDMIDQIMVNWRHRDDKGFPYEIKIYGISNFSIVEEFISALENHKGFLGNIRMSNPETKEYYRFEVTYYKNKTGLDVARAIYKALKEKPSFRTLDLRSTSGKLINFEIK